MIILNPMEPWPGELVLDAAARHEVKVITRVADYGGLFWDDLRPGMELSKTDHRGFRPPGWIEAGLEKQKEDRPFLVTTRPPEHGRSGGGLFLPGGELVGVCVGRIEILKRNRQLGLFASSASIRRMLRDHDLDGTIVRSDAAANRTLQAGRSATRSGVTPTRAKPSR